MQSIKKLLKRLSIVQSALRKFDNQIVRDEFVVKALRDLRDGIVILDAGCGSQRYRSACAALQYRTQDFGGYSVDTKKMLGTDGAGGKDGYVYGPLDYVGNIWKIHEQAEYFDAILCTEVFEHIPYPVETVREFARLLKPGGILILTTPSNCLRHMDPYYYYSGFSDRWFEKVLTDYGFSVMSIEPVGDYYSWIACEIRRTLISHSMLSAVPLFPALLYYLLKTPTQISTDTLCMGYHVLAKKV